MDHRWHSIRPWSPRLVLQVKHVSSVAATFVLCPADEESSTRPISDMLGPNGVAVTVNGSNWHRVLVHVDEASNEAIVVVVGLVPARHYDVELRVDSSDEHEPALAVAETIDTTPEDNVEDDEEEDDGENDSVPSTPTLAPTPPREHTPSPTVEERATQIRSSLSALSNEQSTLTEQLRVVRRDMQRAEAALRAEIDSLKRASDKASAAEQRSKQKVLALQEAVKQSLAATSDAKAEAAIIEDSTATLRHQEDELEAQVARLREEASRIKAQADEAVAADTKRLSDAQQELATYESRDEKLSAKRVRLEEQLPELESRLASLLHDNEELETELAPRPQPRIPLAPSAHSHWPVTAMARQASSAGSH
ncbi:hypothetical protein EXIGLDRAFT_724620 [Exidia glandulosa HHB12029]|uniref:Uncharacterized protein n=1 Tax=Exidia glandulosa HHB12029 TaxID=1314781 RepID=A0A165MQH4_EXIGL|nr:hypothetical protein EXIGLDRAFT_724620 [Exidia glandulosa HHB12029]